MELDDFKNAWQDLNSQTNERTTLNIKIIDEMTRNKYNSGINRIVYSEFIGTVGCLASAVFISSHFDRLNTVFFRCTGVVAILSLVLLSLVSILSIRQLRIKKDVSKTYLETVRVFAVQKMRFLKFQRINFLLCCLLLVNAIILAPMLFDGKDITGDKYFWIFLYSICFGYIFLLLFSRWVFRKYNKALRQTQDLLKDVIA
jgi:hypothetical protein